MKEKVYIFGHQNPDTDSICSTLSYSYLKNQLEDEYEYMPVALKEPNKETAFALDYFGMEAPQIIKNLKPQVSDINFSAFETVQEKDSIRKTLLLIQEQVGRIIPVVDNIGRLNGVVSISDIVPKLLNVIDKEVLKVQDTPLINVINSLQLHTALDYNEEEADKYTIAGNVYLSTDIRKDSLDMLDMEDVIICNYKEYMDYVGKVRWLIVGDLRDEEEIKTLSKSSLSSKETVILYSDRSVLELSQRLTQTVPIRDLVTKKGLEYFAMYETIDDVKENMMTSNFRRFPVVDEKGFVKGVISRSNLVDVEKKKAILVDHNERGQSIDGIEDIDILEIIDHHRVDDITTTSPLYFRAEPLGCTCTIIAKIYKEKGIKIPKEIAGIMLSAIISDTLLFNSPTCTPTDQAIAEELADIAGVDLKLYGMNMIKAGSSIQDESPADILSYDRKKFMLGKYRVSISQINTGDYDGFYKIFDATMAEMKRIAKEEEFDLVVLLVTDVVVGGTELIVAGDERWLAEQAFELPSKDTSIFLPNVFSRKKQIIPKLMNVATM